MQRLRQRLSALISRLPLRRSSALQKGKIYTIQGYARPVDGALPVLKVGTTTLWMYSEIFGPQFSITFIYQDGKIQMINRQWEHVAIFRKVYLNE